MTTGSNDDLIRRIEHHLAKLDDEPWLPDLTADLADIHWVRLAKTMGLAPDSYATARVILKDKFAPRDVIATVGDARIGCDVFSALIPIEILPGRLTTPFVAQGAEFCSADEILSSEILSCVEEALSLLSRIPTIGGTVSRLVKTLHVLRPPNSSLDVSFSDPELPFSIFVSVPEVRVPNDALRVAEAILHEAMHLQLTMIEALVDLVDPSGAAFFSPWRGEYRSPEGILQALYVFRVVHDFLWAAQTANALPLRFLRHAASRRRELLAQANLAQDFAESAALTRLGAIFASCLITIPIR